MGAKRSRLIAAPGERRISSRLPIVEPVRYKIFGQRKESDLIGSGKTVNMSGGGVLFTTESSLVEDARVELAVNWPVTLDGVPLKLVILGRVVWVENERAAMCIERYEFRTRASDGRSDVALPKVS